MTGPRRGRRRLSAALAPLVALALAAPAGARPGQGSGEPSGRVPAMAVIAQNLEVAPTGSFSVYLRITDAPAGSDIAVDIYDPIASAGDLAASTTTDPANIRDTFLPQPLDEASTPSQQTGFTISLYERGSPRPAGSWAYRLDEPGVYPIRVRLRDGDDEQLTSLVTYLVRTPGPDDPPVEPARVALVTTVEAEPAPHPSDDETAAVADGFAADVSRTLQLFAERRSVPASFSVSPGTAERLAADDDRADLVAALRDELERPGRDLLGAPYVPLDPAALVAEGLGGELATQADLGRRTLTTVLGAPGTDAWLVDGSIDVASVDALRLAGAAHLVLPASALASGATAAPVLLPSASGVNAVATDQLFDLTGEPAADPVLAAYQLLGRLAAVGSLTPGGAGVVVRVDPAAAPSRELATVLDQLEEPGTYLAAATVSDLFRDVPTTTDPVAMLTSALRTDLGAYPDRLRQAQQLVASYGSMLPDPAVATAEFERPLARSADRRRTRSEQLEMVDDVRATIQARFDAITVPERDRVTLGARDAQFPLVITSTLGDPVKVVVGLSASDRLSFPDDQIEATLADERTTVQIPVRTRATGDTPLRITVRTPDGLVLIDESQYTVRSTAVSGVGLVLTVGAGGFLALWWGRHLLRARGQRARRRTGATAAEDDRPAEQDLDDDDLFVDP
ncbi:MAG: hypothetical protein KF703_01525 [Actinobacteria bacterium]|nr:hypothetical protein [Actinomycetota bacterium]